MLLRVSVEPQQGARYVDVLAAAVRAEQLGFDGFFRSDHFLRMGNAVSGLPGPTDAWTTLAGLALQTSRIRLGTLVSSVTFRPPGMLAVQAAQVDDMSGGRLELGVGTGWFEPEHDALGIPFPTRRFALLEDQLALLEQWWSTPASQQVSFTGGTVRTVRSPALPKPVQPSLPVIVGGLGPRRTPRLAARYAAELNLPFPAVADIRSCLDRGAQACEEIGRDPQTLVGSVALVGLVGRDEAEYVARCRRIGRDPAELRRNAVAGTPPEVRARAAEVAAAGAQRLYLQIWDLHDLDHLDLLAQTLMGPGTGPADTETRRTA